MYTPRIAWGVFYINERNGLPDAFSGKSFRTDIYILACGRSSRTLVYFTGVDRVDYLLEAANEYAKLFENDYVYTLENGLKIRVYFAPRHFHHLLGFQKLNDVYLLKKGALNSAVNIFRNIINGLITFDDIRRSRFFGEIESRVKHFNQIKRILEFEKIIIDFNPSQITTRIDADYVLFKKSNDNIFLNLFLKIETDNERAGEKITIPSTFVPHLTDYYTYGQTVINILSMTAVPRNTKRGE